VEFRIFYIELQNNQISIKEKIKGDFQVLRREGEEEFFYDDTFWEWFKDKIEYENEPLKFKIDSDKKINFDKSLNIFEIIDIKNRIKKELKENKEKRKGSLTQFMINKIKEYKGRG